MWYLVLSESLPDQKIHWLTLSGSNLNVAHGVGVQSDQMSTELSIVAGRDSGLNQNLWL